MSPQQPLPTRFRLASACLAHSAPAAHLLPRSSTNRSPLLRSVSCYYERGGGRMYRCGLEYLEDESRYAKWLKPWLDAYPAEQLYVFQVRLSVRPAEKNVPIS